ncbi:MAG: Ig-like domain-containing protein [bacterium]
MNTGPGRGEVKPEESGCGGGAGAGGFGGNFTRYGRNLSGGSGYNGYIKNPNSFGSGGGGTAEYPAGSGGGLIKLNVAGTLRLDGIITANGNNAPSGTELGSSGGGAGGSIHITAKELAGNGLINSDGGNGGNWGGGAGGGRIAIFYETNTFAGDITAYGGIGASGDIEDNNGGAGTVYIKSLTDEGELLIDNNNIVGRLTTPTINSNIFHKLTVRNKARFEILPAVDLTVTNLIISGNAVVYDNGKFNATGQAEISEGILYVHEPFNAGNIVVHSGGTITHQKQKTGFEIVLTGNMIVEPGGSIDVSGMGYSMNQGPGHGEGYSAYGSGAGYGGVGGDLQISDTITLQGGTTYGSETAPVDLGSGGGALEGHYNNFVGYAEGGSGGGVIRIFAPNSLVKIDGLIVTNGENGPNAGAGSGGSIYVTSNEFAGSGLITANGGNGDTTYHFGSGGGGGRIAIYNNTNTFDGIITADGGTGENNGAAGTIYVENMVIAHDDIAPVTQLTVEGTEFVSADNVYTNILTEYALSVTDEGDSASGVDYTEYRVDESTWTVYASTITLAFEGRHNIEYRSADVAGNVEEIKLNTYYVDDTLPQTESSIDGPQFNVDLTTYITSYSTVTLAGVDPESNLVSSGIKEIQYKIGDSEWNISVSSAAVNISDLTEGNQKIYYYSKDNVDNQEEEHILDVFVDNTAPTTLLSLVGGQYVVDNIIHIDADTVLMLTSEDFASGVKEIQYRLDGGDYQVYASSIPVTAEGEHIVEFYTTDNVGNEEILKGITVTLDNTAPSSSLLIGIPVHTVADKTYVNVDTLFSITSADSISGVKEINYRFDETSWIPVANSSATFTSVSLVDGEHSLEYYALDNLDNQEDTKSSVVYVDNTPPETQLSVDGEQFDVGGDIYITSLTELVLSATDLGVGVKDTLYRLDSGAYQAYISSITIADEGQHIVEYYSLDNLSNQEAAKSFTVYIDNTPPETTLALEGSQYINGDNTYITSFSSVKLTAVDPEVNGAASGVKETQYQVDISSWTSYGGEFNIPAEGVHNVEYYSKDNLNNTEDIKNKELHVDNTAPLSSLTIDGPQVTEGDTTYVSAYSTFTFTANDVMSSGVASGLGSIAYYVDSGTWASIALSTYTLSGMLEDGEHTLTYKSIDNVDNEEAEKSYTATFDGTKPEVVSTYPLNDAYVKAKDATPVEIVFTEPVFSESWIDDIVIDEAYVDKVKDKDEGIKDYTVSYDSATYTLSIGGELKSGIEYTITLSNNIRDRVENKLDEYSFSFRTLMDKDKGGKVKNTALGIALDIPPNALPEDAYFDMNVVEDNTVYSIPKPLKPIMDNKVFQILAISENADIITREMLKQIKVTIDFSLYANDDVDMMQLVDIETLGVYRTKGSHEVAVELANPQKAPSELGLDKVTPKALTSTPVTEQDTTIAAETVELGRFYLVGFKAPDGSLQDLCSYPNPFEAGKENATIQYYLEEDSSVDIAIYDLVGNLVKTFEFAEGDTGAATGMNMVTWDGKNGVGDVVANGGYIVQAIMKKGDSKVVKRWKILVIK